LQQFGPLFPPASGSLQCRYTVGRAVDDQLVAYLADATYLSYPVNQLLDFILENVSAQGHSSLGDRHLDRTWMGHDPSNGCSNTLLQYVIVSLIAPEARAQFGSGTDSTIPSIAGGGTHPISDLMAGAYALVPEQRPAARAPVGVEEVHCASADDDPGDEIPWFAHGASCQSPVG
jgi:hypothetical protein